MRGERGKGGMFEGKERSEEMVGFWSWEGG